MSFLRRYQNAILSFGCYVFAGILAMLAIWLNPSVTFAWAAFIGDMILVLLGLFFGIKSFIMESVWSVLLVMVGLALLLFLIVYFEFGSEAGA
jgi:hypothetical protein